MAENPAPTPPSAPPPEVRTYVRPEVVHLCLRPSFDTRLRLTPPQCSRVSQGQKVEDTPAPTPPPAPPPAPPPVAAVVETPKTPAPSPPPVWTRQSAVDDDPDRQALARLGLSSRPLEPSVLAVQPPGWLADGWRMIAMVENKPPFQSLATLDHCLKVLVRQAGDDALAGVQQCAHGFSTAGSYHAQHCVVRVCPCVPCARVAPRPAPCATWETRGT